MAVCDAELIGRKLRLSNGFSVEVDKAFYGGVQVPLEDLGKYISQATIVNLLGEKAVGYALKTGLVSRSTVMNIDGVPHIQVFL